MAVEIETEYHVLMNRERTPSEILEEAIAAQRAEVKAAMEAVSAQSLSALARMIGRQPSTLTRFFAEKVEYTLSADTMDRIRTLVAEVRGEPLPVRLPGLGSLRPLGPVDTGDALPFYPAEEADNEFTAAIAAICRFRGNAAAWRMASSCLAPLAYAAGDVLIVDLETRPKPGDVVIATAQDHAGAQPRTIARVFSPPYLVSGDLATEDRKPLPIDDDLISVKGVVIALIRAMPALSEARQKPERLSRPA